MIQKPRFRVYKRNDGVSIRCHYQQRDEPGLEYDCLKKLHNHLQNFVKYGSGSRMKLDYVLPSLDISKVDAVYIKDIVNKISNKNKFPIVKDVYTHRSSTSPDVWKRNWTIETHNIRISDNIREK